MSDTTVDTSDTKKDILVVEDEASIAVLVRDALSSHGFKVRTCNSGKEALQILEEWLPQLIISDIMMPEMDGYAMFNKIRLNRRLRNIPVIFLSAKGSIQEQLKGLERGAVDYVSKPFKIVDLVTKVIFALKKYERDFEKYKEKNLSGTLDQIDVVALLQMMEQNKKTGLLTIRGADGQETMLYFENGNILDAVSGRLGGTDAFYHTLSWDKGEFEFEQQEIEIKSRLPMSTHHLIMEGLRLIDERGKDTIANTL